MNYMHELPASIYKATLISRLMTRVSGFQWPAAGIILDAIADSGGSKATSARAHASKAILSMACQGTSRARLKVQGAR
jgi:hypothetical protein